MDQKIKAMFGFGQSVGKRILFKKFLLFGCRWKGDKIVRNAHCAKFPPKILRIWRFELKLFSCVELSKFSSWSSCFFFSLGKTLLMCFGWLCL